MTPELSLAIHTDSPADINHTLHLTITNDGHISRLLNDLGERMRWLYSILHGKTLTRQCMTQSQIKAVSDFKAKYNAQTVALADEIECLTTLKESIIKDILSDASGSVRIYPLMNHLTARQQAAINCLKDCISEAITTADYIA